MPSVQIERVVVALGLVAGALAVAQGYRIDSALMFHGGLLALAAALALASRHAARRGRLATGIAVNTGICLCLALVLLQCLEPTPPAAGSGGELARAFSYEAAQGDPERFRQWWRRYFAEWERTRSIYTRPDPSGVNPFAAVPGSTAKFFESEVHINALGFRGPEIEREKRGRYRIVALGESTTFGATVYRTDRPWPEVLQERIARELSCDAPVEVVNAGLPGFTLANNLARWRPDILPLEPDLVISYHGYNGFPYVMGALPSSLAKQAPTAPPRPSWLLQRIEEAARIWRFRRRYEAARAVSPDASDTQLDGTRYAVLYRTLVALARARGIPLVLCTFNMAVTEASPEPVVRFYELAFPDVRPRLIANRWHTRVVRRVGEKFGVPVIDTSPGLDGAYQDAFIDLIHMTQLGRERLAENVLAGLEELLRSDPRLRCRPRASD